MLRPAAFATALALAIAVASPAATAEALYPPVSRAQADIDAALKEARQEHKRVIVDFGGNWCPDCKVLDINLRKAENAALLQKDFVMVHVNVGDKGITDNFAVAEHLGVPLKKGVPALAVLDADGRVLYAQKNGEFESMRSMEPRAVNDFLVKWQPR
jgi:thiol:disulfide interchange protein